MEDQIDLAAFKHTSKEEWITKIEAELKGKSVDHLSWTSFDGKSPVFSMREDVDTNRFSVDLQASKLKSNKWAIELDYSSVTKEFYQTLDGEGVDALNVDVNTLSHLPIGSNKEVFLNNLQDPATLKNIDSSVNLVGVDWSDAKAVLPVLGELFAARKAVNGTYSLACANGLQWSNKGAYISQELAFALAEGHDLLVELMKNGNSIDEVSKCVQFKMGIGNSFFKEIAKFRVLRTLWSVIVGEYNPSDGDSSQTRIRAYNSTWNKTAVDEQTNLLRTTTEAMSAILGGVDVLNVMPYNSLTVCSSEAYRWSRNTQLMLRDESFLDRVIDPGAGSYFIENWSTQIADKAWGLFQEIELQGGFYACLDKGVIQEMCEKSACEQVALVESGDRTMIGANAFKSKDIAAPLRTEEGRLTSSVELKVESTEKE